LPRFAVVGPLIQPMFGVPVEPTALLLSSIAVARARHVCSAKRRLEAFMASPSERGPWRIPRLAPRGWHRPVSDRRWQEPCREAPLCYDASQPV